MSSLPATPPQTSTLAVVSLVAGLLGFTFLPLLSSIVAVITGHMARAEIRRAQGQLGGDGLALVGLIIGYCTIVSAVLIVVGFVVFFGGLTALAVWNQG